MLKDDAIREGLIMPSRADIERMNLSKEELKDIRAKHKAHEERLEREAKEKAEKEKANGTGN